MEIYKEINGKKLRRSVIIFITHNDKFLCVKRSKVKGNFQGEWSFIGGKCDETDNTIYDTARRELKEEAGLHISSDVLKSLEYQFDFKDTDNGFYIKFFVVNYTTLPQVILSNEHEDYFWCPLELGLNVLNKNIPESRRFFKHYIENSLFKLF